LHTIAIRSTISAPEKQEGKENRMKATLNKMSMAAGIIVIVWMLTAMASAQCGSLGKPSSGRLKPQSWLDNPSQQGSLVLASENESDEPIVGFWKVTFTAQGNTGIPDGTVIDKAFAQWHGDGTEIMNSSRPPVTSSFCLGVWKKVGPSKYKLNHFAISWDVNNNPVGPANIREDVLLSHDRATFVGTFTIDQYDQSGNVLAHIEGQITGTRINVDTTVSSVL
jgi:hypothetical protein